jgi:hypothetical protein
MPTLEQLQKLNTLANFLEDLPHSRFYMPTWTSPDATESSCGTTGCMCGWAATIFHREGWKMVSRERVKPSLIPSYKGSNGVDGFAYFFGLTFTEAINLTMLGTMEEVTPTPVEAAEAIRKVIRKYNPAVLEDKENPYHELATPAK